MSKVGKSVSSQMSGISQLCTLENCFMFDEEESPKPLAKANNASCVSSGIMEFRADKPYRLSLYVQPSVKRKIDAKNSNVLTNISQVKRNRNKENISKYLQTKLFKQPKQKVNVSLFEESDAVTKNEESVKEAFMRGSAAKTQRVRTATKSILSYIDKNENAEKKTVETEANFVPKAKQNKIRKSYEKKYKTYPHTENIVEPSSEEILKEIDMKRITKSKVKKPNKEDPEFEKWAETMNSAFDDIDKFELSINYD